MFSLLLESSPFSRVQQQLFNRESSLGSHGGRGELWPGHFLLINPWILIIFLSRKLLQIRHLSLSGHHVNRQRPPF